MLLGNVIDQFHDQHCFTNTCTAKQADLTALGIGSNQVNHLDTGFQNLGGSFLFFIGRSGTVNGPAFFRLRIGLIVNGLAQQIENAAKALVAHRNSDGTAGIHCIQAAHHTIRCVHGNAAGHIVAHVLRHFGHDLFITIHNFNGSEQFGKMAVFKTDIQHRANNLNYLADIFFTQINLSFPLIIALRRQQFR